MTGSDFDDIAADLDALPLLYAVTLATLQAYSGSGYTTAALGLVVWDRLSHAERREALSHLLECYVSRVVWEQTEQAQQAQQAAADAMDQLDSCLEPFDLDSVADALADTCGLPPSPDEIAIDRGVAQRLIDEVALLRRRTTTTEVTP